MKVLRVSDEAHKAVKRLAAEANCTMSAIADAAIFDYTTDPRSPAERAEDDFRAEVLDTQASDRP